MHEWTHAMNIADMTARRQLHPLWILEGFGSLYEQVGINDGRAVGYTNWRLPQIQSMIQSGSVIHLHGLRSAAKVAGWDKEHFDAVYSYLSAQPHSTPMGFYRMDERGIDNKAIAPYQFFFVGFALEHAQQSVTHATARLRELFSKQENQRDAPEQGSTVAGGAAK